jgi:hypothetical protein
MHFLLQVATVGHVLEVDSHVSCQDIADHHFPYCLILKSRWPEPAKDLRECGTMERFKN